MISKKSFKLRRGIRSRLDLLKTSVVVYVVAVLLSLFAFCHKRIKKMIFILAHALILNDYNILSPCFIVKD